LYGKKADLVRWRRKKPTFI